MKIIYVTPMATHPVNNGARRRMVALADALRARGAQLFGIVAPYHPSSEAESQAMRAYWGDDLRIVSALRPEYHPGAEGYGIDEWYSMDVSDAIAEVIEAHQPDLIYSNYCFMTAFKEDVAVDLPLVVDTHDILSGRFELYRDIGQRPGFFYTNEAEEERGLSRADLVIAIQSRECGLLQARLPGRSVMTVGQPQPLWDDARRAPVRDIRSVGMIGSAHLFNIHGMNAFADSFYRYKDGWKTPPKLVVAGSVCDKIDASGDWIEKRGLVDDIEAFYDEVDLLVSPVEVGTGLKIKTVEALCSGRPVITTEVGSDGLPTSDQAHQCFAVEAMITELHWALTDPERLQKLEASSRDLARSYNAQVNEALEKLWERMEALAARGRNAPPGGARPNPLTLHIGRPILYEGRGAALSAFGWRDGPGRQCQSIGSEAQVPLRLDRRLRGDGVVLRIGLCVLSSVSRKLRVECDGEALFDEELAVGPHLLAMPLPGKGAGDAPLTFSARDVAGQPCALDITLQSLTVGIPVLQPGQMVELGAEEARPVLSAGWSHSEGSHVWSIASESVMTFLAPLDEASLDLSVLLKGHPGAQLSLCIGDTELATATGNGAVMIVSVPLPETCRGRVVQLRLCSDRGRSFPGDTRNLYLCAFKIGLARSSAAS